MHIGIFALTGQIHCKRNWSEDVVSADSGAREDKKSGARP